MTKKDKSNNKKDGLIMERTARIEDKEKSAMEIKQKKLDIIDREKEKGIIRKGIVKKMLEKIERQNDNTLKLANIKTMHKKLYIESNIEKERHMTRKEKENERHNSDSLVKVVNKEEKDNSSKKSNSLKEEIDERIKSIEISMTYAQDNGLAGKPIFHVFFL